MNSDVFQKAMYSGISGAGAMTIQVGSLMWLRTIMNYQYKYGGTINDTCKVLYKEGGIPRFYRGLLPALAQGPLSRFGDTFSNSLVLAFCTNSEYAKQLPIWTQTMGASVCAGLFRSLLMPIDTLKTLIQAPLLGVIPKLNQSEIKTPYSKEALIKAASFIQLPSDFSTRA